MRLGGDALSAHRFHGAAVAATIGKAKLHGLITDHHHVTGEIKQIREMSDEDLDDEINKLVRKPARERRCREGVGGPGRNECCDPAVRDTLYGGVNVLL